LVGLLSVTLPVKRRMQQSKGGNVSIELVGGAATMNQAARLEQ